MPQPYSEAQTRQEIIDKRLALAGWDVDDPSQVTEELEEGGEERYVWWAKVRSPNRQQPLPHTDDILAIQEQIEAAVETHLYLTDYRSLCVGQLDEITADRIRSDTPGEVEHMTTYYEGMQADFWFRLLDIRRIVSDDTPVVIQELKQLRNKRYNDRPVSLYGGNRCTP